MSFDSKRLKFDREHIYIVEIDLDKCDLTFGVAPCVGGIWQLTVSSVTGTNDVGDEIEGGTSGAIAILVDGGTSPWQYRITNGIQFTGSEVITNNTQTGSATKNGTPAQQSTADDKCYNTFESCQDVTNYTDFRTTGSQTIAVNATNGTFTRSSGSFLTDGIEADKPITTSGHANAGNNSDFIAASVTALVVTVDDITGLVTETGTGDEVITQPVILTHRMCEERSPQPKGLDAIPSLDSISISPSKIDIKGGLGVRSSVSLSFKDHPSSDIGIDPYVSGRTYTPFEIGTYWGKLRARNPNYQARPLRLLSGYLESDGSYDTSNFQTRSYIIDKMDVGNGKSNVTGKDPLKLASRKKAQVPAPNTGQLNADILIGAASLVLKPTGVGDSDGYATTGSDNYILIGSEVIEYTRVATSDTLTLVTRGAFNTVAAAHTANDAVQQCYYNNDTVDNITSDIMINFANMPAYYFPLTEWSTEIDAHLSGLLEGIIVKPMDVWKALIELGEAAPHYLWWDEISTKINLTALKAPPPTAVVLNMDEHLIADSVKVIDKPDMRVSTVFVNFGQIDPTKSLDEPGNFSQTHLRVDTESIDKYNSSVVKTVNSRWLNDTNRASAIALSTLIGRRFSNTPREIKFSMDAKDADVWVGQSRSINYRDICDFAGNPLDTIFQLTSARESVTYDYEGLEFAYGNEITGDPVSGSDPVYLVTDNNVNMKDVYETNFGSITGKDVTVIFYISTGINIGSTSIGSDSLDTGDWSAANSFDVTLQLDSGSFVCGKGGDANDGDGGDAVNLQINITLINNGVIGGGGGAGGGDSGVSDFVGGGGGAGVNVGLGAPSFEKFTSSINGEDGTKENGGDGGETTHLVGGDGGDLGQNGQASGTPGGNAGKAINLNANTITYTVTGDIRGTVS